MRTNFTLFRRAARSAGLVTVGVLSTPGALSLSRVGSVQARSPVGGGNTASSARASISGGKDLTESSASGWKAGSQSGVPFPLAGHFTSG